MTSTETTELGNESAVLPASFAQQRMWFLDRLEAGGGGIYNVPAVTRLRGPLDLDPRTVGRLQRRQLAALDRRLPGALDRPAHDGPDRRGRGSDRLGFGH